MNIFPNHFLYMCYKWILQTYGHVPFSPMNVSEEFKQFPKILPTIKFLNLVFLKTFASFVFYKATTESSWPPADNITTFASIYWSIAKTGSTHKPFGKIYVLHDSNLSINAHALFFKCDSSIHNKTSVKKGSQIQ